MSENEGKDLFLIEGKGGFGGIQKLIPIPILIKEEQVLDPAHVLGFPGTSSCSSLPAPSVPSGQGFSQSHQETQGEGRRQGQGCFHSRLKLFINFKYCSFSFSSSGTILFQVSAHGHNSHHSIKPHFQSYKQGWLFFYYYFLS